MARMPGAEFQGEHGSRSMSRFDIVCIHTIVGFAPAHAAHFSTHADGRIDQSRDTEFRSGANLDGNHRIIAIENEDHGPAFGQWDTKDGHAVPAFTEEQIEAIARICAWANETHAIPLEPCPDSKPDSRGIAYHRQGIDGNFADFDFGGRVSGGEVWTESPGKVCPGDRRIAQIPKIIARARQIAEEEELMALSPETLKAIRGSLLNAKIRKADGTMATVRGLLTFTHAHAIAAEQEARKARKLAELAAKRAGVIAADIDTLLAQAEAEAAAEAAHAAVTEDTTDDPDL
jgi:hypothetical protein